MKTSDFYFDLPPGLIAQSPPEVRGSSRLLVLHPGPEEENLPPVWEHRRIDHLTDYLQDTLVVFNDTRVRRARIFAYPQPPAPGSAGEPGHGRVEFLLLERQGEDWLALASRAKRQRPGKVFFLEGGIRGEILPRREGEIGEAGGEGNRTGLRGLRFTPPLTEDYLEKHGHIPLPPYIRRPDTDQDRERYQTVYARETGSAAAPTAGLHFTPELMDRVRERAWGVAWVTLHVGLGTFLPVRSPAVEDHRMHREVYTIRPEEAALINRARREGKKILAVGTTTLRALESACRRGEVAAGEGSTSIFIYPGYRFQMVDRLLTNFHTPESTLLMLVSALAGRRRILAAYAEAIKEGYRFFSFGDAMLIL